MGLIPDDIDKKKAIILGVSGVAILAGVILVISSLLQDDGPRVEFEGPLPAASETPPSSGPIRQPPPGT